MTLYNGAVYFVASDAVHGSALWRTTLTATVMVTDVNPLGDSQIGGLHVHDGQLYFDATDGVTGRELWRYDGATATRLTDLNPGPASSSPYNLFSATSNTLFLSPPTA